MQNQIYPVRPKIQKNRVSYNNLFHINFLFLFTTLQKIKYHLLPKSTSLVEDFFSNNIQSVDILSWSHCLYKLFWLANINPAYAKSTVLAQYKPVF